MSDPKILFLGFTSKKYKGHSIEIDRPDLTRKMSCMETWVPRIEALGHEVIFFDGGNDNQTFDKKNRILHLISNESYDYHHLRDIGFGSLMFERLKEAVSWSLRNKEFDYIFRIDDGSYLNAWKMPELLEMLKSQPDIVFSEYGGGGAGIIFSKKACEALSVYQNHMKIHIEDQAVSQFSAESGLNVVFTNLLCPQYLLGEKFFSFHYTNGKRQYFSDDVISYYNMGLPIKRKVMINFPFDLAGESGSYLPLCTWSCDSSEKTPLWYSFDKDEQNWEYYGNYARSSYSYNQFCPFGKSAIQELAFWNANFDFSSEHEQKVFIDYIDSVNDDGSIYFILTENYRNKFGENYLKDCVESLSKFIKPISVVENVKSSIGFEISQNVTTITAKKI